MSPRSTRFRWGAALVLALLAGCAAPAPVSPSGAQSGAPEATGPRVEGSSRLAAGPFANAAVRVYRLDTDALVGEGQTDAAGAFSVPVTAESTGLALRVDVSRDGKSLGAIAGRVKAAGPYRVAQAETTTLAGVKVTLASTLALRAFLAQLKAVSVSLLPPGQKEIPVNLLAKLLAAYERASAGAESSLQGADLAALEAAIAQSGPLSGDLQALFEKAGTSLQSIGDSLDALAKEATDANGPNPALQGTSAPSTPASTTRPGGSAGPNGSGGTAAEPSPSGPPVDVSGGFDVPRRAPVEVDSK